MLLASGILLALFFAIDTYYYKRDGVTAPPDATGEKLKVEGLFNLLLLGVIVGAVLFSGTVKLGEVSVLGVPREIESLIRDGVMVLMAIISLKLTKQEIREGNDFSWFPIQEVAYLFAGIFMTMIPALAILRAGEHGALAGLIRSVKEPYHFFWITGILSSFLDNAPTYLTFFNTALGRFFVGVPEHQAVHMLIAHKPLYLEAISAGAVFMGANTYIGNAPNFMIRSIAEEAGVPMPSFFGYILKFSLPILIPIFFLVTFVFFR